MNTQALRFAAPRSDEAHALNDLLADRDRPAATARDAENAPRLAAEEAQRASNELAALERRALGGEAVTDANRTKVEKRLAAAKAKANEPHAERAQGARAALLDIDGQIAAYVTEHHDALNGELADDAQAAASRVNDALQEIIDAHAAREAIAARVNALASVIRRVQPGEVAWSKVEGVAREAEAVLLADGEAVPVMRAAPRVTAEFPEVADVWSS